MRKRVFVRSVDTNFNTVPVYSVDGTVSYVNGGPPETTVQLSIAENCDTEFLEVLLSAEQPVYLSVTTATVNNLRETRNLQKKIKIKPKSFRRMLRLTKGG